MISLAHYVKSARSQRPPFGNSKHNGYIKGSSFVGKIVFGCLNYNPMLEYRNRANFRNGTGLQVTKFCQQPDIQYHAKDGTLT